MYYSVLFELFDLNEMNSLSIYEIEYLVHCSLVSSFKIFSITNKIDQQELSRYIELNFFEDARTNISQLIKWGCSSAEIEQFFVIIKREPPQSAEAKANSKNSEAAKVRQGDRELLATISNPFTKEVSVSDYIFSSEYKNMMNWITNIHSKVNHPSQIICRTNGKPLRTNGVRVSLNWVYGIRCTDVVRSFLHYIQKTEVNTELIIYFVASIVVVFYLNSNEQKHYLQHSAEVTAVAISPNGLVASAERKVTPEIHLWRIGQWKALRLLTNLHRSPIYLMEFIKGDRFLLSCGKRAYTTVVISDLDKEHVHYSTSVDVFVRNIITITNTLGEGRKPTKETMLFSSQNKQSLQEHFLLFGRDRVYQNQCVEFDYRMKPLMLKQESGIDLGSMTSGISLLVNLEHPEFAAISSSHLLSERSDKPA